MALLTLQLQSSHMSQQLMARHVIKMPSRFPSSALTTSHVSNVLIARLKIVSWTSDRSDCRALTRYRVTIITDCSICGIANRVNQGAHLTPKAKDGSTEHPVAVQAQTAADAEQGRLDRLGASGRMVNQSESLDRLGACVCWTRRKD